MQLILALHWARYARAAVPAAHPDPQATFYAGAHAVLKTLEAVAGEGEDLGATVAALYAEIEALTNG